MIIQVDVVLNRTDYVLTTCVVVIPWSTWVVSHQLMVLKRFSQYIYSAHLTCILVVHLCSHHHYGLTKVSALYVPPTESHKSHIFERWPSVQFNNLTLLAISMHFSHYLSTNCPSDASSFFTIPLTTDCFVTQFLLISSTSV